DERREADQDDVERVDVELRRERAQRAVGEHRSGEERRGDEGAQAEERVQLRGPAPMAERAEHDAAGEREGERPVELHQRGSFSFSRCSRSRLSKVSRIWKKNTPNTNMPTSTSSAMPSSTTIGMPWVALVAAKNR